MYKILAAFLGICLLLGSAPTWAQKEAVTEMKALPLDTRITSEMAAQLRELPDLTVDSAKVLAAPFPYDGKVLVPLEITISNKGATTDGEFNVGAWGKATDGNAYGFSYFSPGEEVMPDPRGGVLCDGLASGEVKTYQGFLFLGPNPINEPLNPGTKYEIHAMVDYNLDPDASYYEWGVAEKDETNNELVITYPQLLTAIAVLDLKKLN
jgi:hypothetical protein